MFRNFFMAAAVIVASPHLVTQAVAQNDVQTVEYAGETWRVTAREAKVASHMGRDALMLQGGRLWLDSAQFSDGVFEFDVAYDEQQIFVGAGWRIADDGHFEEMYMRGHLNEKPDALQYTPVENTLSAWQIFSDGNANAPITQVFDGWNKVRIIVEGDRADIYVNSDAPVIHIPDLKREKVVGGVNLRASGRNAGPAYFSNINVRALRDDEGVVGEPKEGKPLPDGLIRSWRVSAAVDEKLLAEALTFPEELLAGQNWTELAVETNGIANLAKIADPQQGADTLLIHATLTSNKKQMKELTFGYSDRVRIYLNGKRVYFGNAGWRVRDYRFLGTVGFHDAVGLDLKKGDNELVIAVSETFGGWAWAGAMIDTKGLKLRN